MIYHVKNKEEFEKLVNENENILVDFFTSWCGPCKMLTPVIEELDESGKYNLAILKVDAEEVYEVSSKFGIQAVPSLFLIKNKEVKASTAGYLNLPDLEKFVSKIF